MCTTMDEAIEFIRGYLQKEHVAMLALYGEQDDAIFQRKVQDLRGYLDPRERFDLGMTRPKPADRRWFRNNRDSLVSTIQRPLFQLMHYRHPVRGDLFEAYVGLSLDAPEQFYAEALFVAREGERLGIVARYTFCRACRGTQPCSECSSSGWVVRNGAKLDTLGELVESRKLTPPTEPVSRADYEKG